MKEIYSNRIILSNCLIQAIIRKLENREGKIGYGIKSENNHIYFFYELNGVRYRFARKMYLHKNKNRVLFYGYCYKEDPTSKRSSINDYTKILL